jgi:stress-induced morphogen
VFDSRLVYIFVLLSSVECEPTCLNLSKRIVGLFAPLHLYDSAKDYREAHRWTETINAVSHQRFPGTCRFASFSHSSGHIAMKGKTDPESHFIVKVISQEFAGKALVARHRMVYSLLSKEMETIHALNIIAKDQ